MKKNRILNAKHDSFLLFVCIFFLYRAVHAIFVWTQNRANSRTRGETIFQTKTKQSDRKLREIVDQDTFLKLFVFSFKSDWAFPIWDWRDRRSRRLQCRRRRVRFPVRWNWRLRPCCACRCA